MPPEPPSWLTPSALDSRTAHCPLGIPLIVELDMLSAGYVKKMTPKAKLLVVILDNIGGWKIDRGSISHFV